MTEYFKLSGKQEACSNGIYLIRNPRFNPKTISTKIPRVGDINLGENVHL